MRAKPNLLLLAVVVASSGVLASCAHEITVPHEVKVAVPVPCLKPQDAPQRPPLRSAADLLAMDTYRRTLAAWSDLKAYEAYTAELEAAVAACSRIPADRPP